MRNLELVTSYTGLLLLALTVAGVLARGRFRRAPVFTVYLAFISVVDASMLGWPQRFYTRDLWLFREIVIAALRFGVILELAHWIFKGFPAAAVTLKRTLLLALVATYAAVVAIPTEGHAYPTLVAHVLPRAANGSIWVLTAISALVLWYRLPLHRFHKSILVGLASYLLTLTVLRGLLASSAWQLREPLGYLEIFAFLLLEAYWCHAAWRRVGEPVTPRPTTPLGLPATARQS